MLKNFLKELLMKKLLLALSIIAGLLSNAFAIDLISVATNGKSNENSLGVKTLNNQEMSEIVGGFTYIGYYAINGIGYFSGYFAVQQKDFGPAGADKYLSEIKSLLKSGEVLAVGQRYQNMSASGSIWLVGYNPTTNSIREIPFGASASFYNILKNRFSSDFGTRFPYHRP